MITILIGAILGLIVGVLMVWYFDGDLVDYFISSWKPAIIGAVIGFIVAVALPMNKYVVQSSLNIVSLQDNSGGNDGTFLLGCGRIEDKMKYAFYYQDSSLYRMMQINCEDAAIKYTDSIPKVNIYQEYPDTSRMNYYALDFTGFKKTYVIEVPKGTIKGNYNLDAQ